jgi:hypothetical protein
MLLNRRLSTMLTSPFFCHCEPYRAWQSSRRRRGRCPCFGWIAASGCRPPRNDNVWRLTVTPVTRGFGLFYCDSSMTAQQVALMEMNWSLPWGKELSKYFWMGLLRVFTRQEPSASWWSRSHFIPDLYWGECACRASLCLKDERASPVAYASLFISGVWDQPPSEDCRSRRDLAVFCFSSFASPQ